MPPVSTLPGGRVGRGYGAFAAWSPSEQGTSSGDDLTVTCVQTATVVATTLTELRNHASRCTPDPVTCSAASWDFCEQRGYPAGFGPVTTSTLTDDVEVVCLQ